MAGRNPLGARLPARGDRPPRLAPDGSPSMDHGGSFGTYMAHKIGKLGEQFQANAAEVQRTQLFQGVAIHVDGVTTPSHLVRLVLCWSAAGLLTQLPLCCLGGCSSGCSTARRALVSAAVLPCTRHLCSPHRSPTQLCCYIAQELRQLMALHGGEFHNYYHRSAGGCDAAVS